MADDARPPRSIRVAVQHFALPRYRVPVFRELSATPGIDLTVVFGRAPGLANVEAVGFRAVPGLAAGLRLPFGRLLWDRAQWRLASRRRADVLILSWNVRSLTLLPALLRARVSGVPTLLWGHGYSRRDTAWRSLARRLAARLADGVILYARRDAERLIAATGRTDGVFVAPNSLDQEPIRRAAGAWSEDPGALAEFRRQHRLEPGATLLFVSRFKPENRVDLLLEAAALLRGRRPDLAVVVIGEGHRGRPELEALRSRLGLGDAVRFVGPVYDEMALAPWFLCADLFVYPSNLGLSILHAFGYGLPVVTSDRGDKAAPEWQALEPGVNGVTYAHGDVGALADAVAGLLDDAPRRVALAEGALRTVSESYTLEAMVRGLRDAVSWAAERRRS